MKENQLVSDQDKSSSVAIENSEPVKNPDAVLAKNRELLAEKKSMADKLAKYESDMQKINDSKLEAEGKKDEVIASLRKQLGETNEVLTKKEKSYNWNTVSSQIKEAAAAKGCTSPVKLLRLLGEEDLNSIEVYDDFSVNKNDLNRVLENAMKEHSDIGLFKSKVSVNDITPSNNVNMTKEKAVGELTKEEILEQLNS